MAFTSAGAEVLVNDLRQGRAAEVVDEITDAGGHALPLAFDVTDYDAVMERVGEAGSVDVLINNAGNAGAEGSPPEHHSPRPSLPTGRRSFR